MTKNMKALMLALLALTPFSTTIGQNKVEPITELEVASAYIWRGQNLGGISFQPNIGVGYRNFSLTAFGSVGLDQKDTKELNFTLGYDNERFSLSVTDYWVDRTVNEEGESVPQKFFTRGHTNHVFGAQIGCNFGVASIDWYTNFAGADGKTLRGKRAYSSYCTVAAPFTAMEVDFTAEVGVVPWATDYYNGYTNRFAVTEVSLLAEKEVAITDRVALPLFTKLIVNPCMEDVYLTFGLSF